MEKNLEILEWTGIVLLGIIIILLTVRLTGKQFYRKINRIFT